MQPMIRKDRLLTLLLAALAVIQAAVWLAENGGAFRRVWADLSQPALWRGAAYSQSPRFAGYILFLNQIIPQDMRVVLPPAQTAPKALGSTPSMQFFLSPRSVINCNDPACIENLSLEYSAVLVVGEFPGQTVDSVQSDRLMYDESWGVLLPAGKTVSQPVPQPGGLLELLASAILPLAWIGALSLAAWLLVLRWLPGDGLAVGVSLSYGLGLAILSLGLALLSLLGVRLNEAAVVAITVTVLLIAGIVPWNWPGRPTRTPDPWLLAISGLSLGAAFLSAGRGYSASDEFLLWGSKGYGIAADGGIAGVTNWGTNTVDYPLHVPVLIAAFKLLSFETLPASKLAFSAYFSATVLMVYAILLRCGLPCRQAGMSALLLGMAPLFFRHATLAYANLPLAFYLLAGMYLLAQAFSGEGDFRTALGAGLFLAAAAWTRPEGLALAVLTLLVSLGMAWRGRWHPQPLRLVVASSAPVAIYTLFWGMLWLQVYANSGGRATLLADALAGWSAGNLHLAEAAYILRTFFYHLVDPARWGIFGAALLAALAAALWGRRTRPRWATIAMACGLAYTLAILGIYYLASYSQEHDISWWVSTGLDRMLFPALIFLWSGALGGLPAIHRS